MYGGGEVVEDVDIRLPIHSLYEHVLVVGTTGKGKTTLLKNMALALLNEVRDSVVIALDLQGDYPHLTMPNPSTSTPLLVYVLTKDNLRNAYPNVSVSVLEALISSVVATSFLRNTSKYSLAYSSINLP